MIEKRPWGQYEVIRDEPDYKLKMITVDPGQQLSYQYHHKRHEHWVFVSGVGELVLDDKIHDVVSGGNVLIPVGCKHRIKNTGKEPLRFIEVQLGEYFGEDDIVRLKDDYGRTDNAK